MAAAVRMISYGIAAEQAEASIPTTTPLAALAPAIITTPVADLPLVTPVLVRMLQNMAVNPTLPT
jgi:hypothetical protein